MIFYQLHKVLPLPKFKKDLTAIYENFLINLGKSQKLFHHCKLTKPAKTDFVMRYLGRGVLNFTVCKNDYMLNFLKKNKHCKTYLHFVSVIL